MIMKTDTEFNALYPVCIYYLFIYLFRNLFVTWVFFNQAITSYFQPVQIASLIHVIHCKVAGDATQETLNKIC